MFASRRAGSVLASILVAAVAVAQVGCGVLHCVTGSGEVAERADDVPPCHGTPDGDPRETAGSHAPGDGSAGCCLVMPMEQSPAGATASIHPILVAAHIPTIGLRPPPTGWRTAPGRETGPPRALSAAAPTPLRI